MTFEVIESVDQPVIIGSVANVIVIGDVRSQQPDVRPGEAIELVVMTTTGAPVHGRATVVQKPSGRGLHFAFACPSCAQVAFKLYPASEGGLACRVCTRTRSRRQRERTTRSWRDGGQQEDALLRALGKGLPVGRTLPEHLHQRVDELHRADLQRLESLGFLPRATKVGADHHDLSWPDVGEDDPANDAFDEQDEPDVPPGDWSPDPAWQEEGHEEVTPVGYITPFELQDEHVRLGLATPTKKPPARGGFIDSLARFIFELETAEQDQEPRS